jgi:hypothetical protein
MVNGEEREELKDDWDCPPVLKLKLYTFADDSITVLFKQGRLWFINIFGSAKLWH